MELPPECQLQSPVWAWGYFLRRGCYELLVLNRKPENSLNSVNKSMSKLPVGQDHRSEKPAMAAIILKIYITNPGEKDSETGIQRNRTQALVGLTNCTNARVGELYPAKILFYVFIFLFLLSRNFLTIK